MMGADSDADDTSSEPSARVTGRVDVGQPIAVTMPIFEAETSARAVTPNHPLLQILCAYAPEVGDREGSLPEPAVEPDED